MKYRRIMFNGSLFISFSQFVTILFKSVSIRRSNLKFRTGTSTKDTHQILKNQLSIVDKYESLIATNTEKFVGNICVRFRRETTSLCYCYSQRRIRKSLQTVNPIFHCRGGVITMKV